jgi:ABC-type amino acid transport substrate-binding protein
MRMERCRMMAAAIALAGLHCSSAPAAASEPLTICLDEDIPLYSVHHGGEGSGFVLAVSQAVARQLGRPLRVQWFESKIDPDDSSVLGANALLSDRRCQLVGGYPLVRDALGKPGVQTARLPDFDGAAPEDRRRRVPLGALLPTRAFTYAPFTIILGPNVTKHVASLADLEGMRLGVEAATLEDAILMLYRDGAYVERITHLVPGRHQLLPRLEAGDYDATLVELRRFDAYRAAHPATRLKPTGYYYDRVGFNIGFVGRDGEEALIDQVNQAIEELLAKNKVAPLAQAEGVTYLPPRQPEILEHLTLRDLSED